MPGWFSRILLCLAACGVMASTVLPGRQIYLEGRGRDAIEARLRGIDVSVDAGSYVCVRCHGADGGGASEGGITAPPLTIARDMNVADTRKWLHGALVEGRGHDGRRLGDAMPAFRLSAADLDALATYIRTLPYPAEPGIEEDEILIGIDLAGTGLTPAERSIAVAHLQKTADTRAGANGIFGRRLVLMDAAAKDQIITLSWSSAASGERLHFAVRADDRTDARCDTCCGALHESVDGQAERLKAFLQRQGRSSVIVDSAQNVHPATSSTAAAMIYSGNAAAELAALLAITPSDRDVYAFTEAISPTQFRDAPRVAFVASIDLQAQVEAVQSLLQQSNETSLSAHGASVTIEMAKALDIVLDRLASRGRRISQYVLCSDLARASNVQRPLTIIHGGGQALEVVKPGS
ncbi:cytochrome c [Pistricoccus aurantiacus]|uniref:Cytochrome c n=2 Tax=Pistricoccus aurantiacus TaxID=1883414 RepID=A0A5B8SKY7_9GAMM|nr:cytochrome c [Pistricoccus aurantiacus]